MRKILASLLVLMAFACVSISANAETIEKEKGYVSVNSSITKEVVPNQAEITINIETNDKTLHKAAEDNKVIAGKVYAAIKALLGPNDYIRTNNFSAKPQYVYNKDNKRVFDKYTVSNSVVVRTKSTTLVSKIVDAAMSQGATGVEDLQFSLSDYDSISKDAIAEVTKKAYSQANAVAIALGARITGVKSVNVNCNSENNQRPYYGMMAKGSMDSAAATPIESGKLKIYVNVDASFYVN